MPIGRRGAPKADKVKRFDGPLSGATAPIRGRMSAAAEREAVDLLCPLPNERILVVGFGAGVGLKTLLQREPELRIVGVDPSGAMTRVASRTNRAAVADGRLKVLQTTLEAFEAEAELFDGAIMVNALQLFDPVDAAADSLARSLRSGGRFISLTHERALDKRGDLEAHRHAFVDAFARAGFREIAFGRGRSEQGRIVRFTAMRG